MKYLILTIIVSFNAYAELFPSTTDQQCVDFALKQIRGKVSKNQLQALNESCKYNYNNLCLYEITKDLDYNKFDEISELIELANNCQFVRPRCVGVIKKYLKRDQYDELNEITKISKICHDTSFKCLEMNCSKDYKNCESLEQIELIAPDCLR